MRTIRLVASCFVLCLSSICIFSQGSVLINDPAVELPKAELSASEKGLLDTNVLPKVRKILAGDTCEETIEVSGVLQGAFTRTGSKQTLIFYQFCQTGNGLGAAGIAVIEDGKVVSSFASDNTGWTLGARALPEINKNGVDEFALYYSGGMHQGEGGTGLDILEFSSGGLKGIGWFQADGYTEKGPVFCYRVTAKPDSRPLFFSEKYLQNSAGKWRKTGTAVALKLKEINGVFKVVNQ